MYTVEIKNIKEVQRALKRYPTVATKHIDKAIKSSIMTVNKGSKRNTPVDTGYLRRSHESRFQPLKGILEPRAEYAAFVHEGTRRMKARPFLKDALDESESDINKYFEKGLNDTMDEIARSV